ncbi:MAG: ADP-glyceromanno-heptose 6-epimerase [Rhodospirillaceae bacterium]|nr:ADP-glyceromanno-heptose 6-epimerase [Rhodospirillaceae bacterium]MBT4464509.1 ADP-glyceromanno-heptose 6-epimerase [Rhodospirillaceae bacterium]MBT5307892.1 ADP-glyceromanno-heptose 6-epimerase [Rhodospirillaceae bacterium]MBT7354991.1 ADP-glyceromanno-heptose 6-epimerase [Rhodospirillaceae bacterium]
MYVVTGGAGFIGSNIVAAIEERGLGPVVISDRLRDGNKWLNVAKRALSDLVAPEKLFDYLGDNEFGIKGIIHMGAISSTTETDVDLIFENNFRLTLDLWKWCTAHHVPFIYASSAATYGDGSNGFVDDGAGDALSGLRPLNPYGWSKNLFDRRVARVTANEEPTPPQWVGLKFFNVYGPNEYHKGSMQSVASKVFRDVGEGKSATLFESHHPDYEHGGQLRDFIWVGDCVDVVLWMIENPDVSGLFNCGTGKARSFLDVVTSVYAAIDKTPDVNFVETPVEIRDKYQYFTEADMSRLKAVGYDKPFTSLEDGIGAYVRDYLAADDPYR